MFARQRNVVDAAQLEELRRQDARRALERECRTLRKQFASLEQKHQSMRAEQDYQCQRLDSMVVQSGALLTLINSLNRDYVRYDDNTAEEKNDVLQDRFRLLRKNADLELQVSSMATQFVRLVTDYEDLRTKFDELKSAVASASTIEELSGWEQL
jgi:hypothetical protein